VAPLTKFLGPVLPGRAPETNIEITVA